MEDRCTSRIQKRRGGRDDAVNEVSNLPRFLQGQRRGTLLAVRIILGGVKCVVSEI